MIVTFKKVFALFNAKEKQQIYKLVLLIFIMGLFETAGVASILPFLAVLANPDSVTENEFLMQAYQLIGSADPQSFLVILGLGVLAVLIVSNGFSALTTWLLLRFIYLSGHTLSNRLLRQYLGMPYPFFLNRNTADFAKNIVTEVHRVIVGVMTPTIQIVTRIIISLCLLTLILALDPMLALLVFVVCGGTYALVFLLTKKKLTQRGQISADAQGLRLKLVNEAFGGIKEIKLMNRTDEFCRRYALPSHRFAISEATGQSIMLLPKYALETIVFGGVLVIILYHLSRGDGSINSALPIMGLYTFAGYRLMPAFNQIFNGLTNIRYHSAVLDIIRQDLEATATRQVSPPHNLRRLNFNHSLQLDGISYTYPGGTRPVLNNISLSIGAKSTTAFVGPTGSGKTTIVDIILGLLPVDSGLIKVDGVTVDEPTVHQWQNMIGYVPQDIFLADDTLAHNIAYGLPAEHVDRQKVEQAARLANLHDFISTDLPDGYETIVGERGVRLSGGQRQRVGIARALYHQPEVLVLDEATSSLDGITENVIMEAINSLASQKTIIMIAHRLTTVRECDVIYFLDSGNVAAQGTFEELMEACPAFRKMAAE
jgi:ABC-type multidrug transport system fused ATPase/permease subunit